MRTAAPIFGHPTMVADTPLQPSPTLRVRRPLPLLAALALACACLSLPAQARVEATLSAREVPANQAVELTLVGISEGGTDALSPPDLSVLEPDFRVLDRRVERRVSVTNGRRREEVRLRLLLLPQRGGELELPAIAFGAERSEPLSLVVSGEPSPAPGDRASGSGTSASPPPGSAASPLDGATLPPGYPSQGPWSFDRSWSWGGESGAPDPGAPPTVPWPGGGQPFPYPAPGLHYDPFQGGTMAPGFRPSDPGTSGPGGSAGSGPDSEAATPARSNPWFWTSLALAAILVTVLIRRSGASMGRTLRRSGRADRPEAPRAPADPLSAAAAAPPDPFQIATESVREAYRRGDGGAAREALLAWARLRWPADPPNNLARLAQRCQPPLRDYITDLEKAFFSPRPIHWDREPVADLLPAEENPPQGKGAVPA